MSSINTKGMSYDEWKESRRKGIGGSDVGAIMGYNKYKSPYGVYLDKIGKSPEYVDSESAYWGRTLEDIVAKEFTKRTGKKVRNVNKILIHNEYDFMIANLDRSIVGENAILEVKTANQFLMKEWEDDEVPESYIFQAMHYMAVTNTDKCYFAVLIGGQKFIFKEVERNEELIDIMIEKEKEFWKMVQNKIPPVMTAYDKELLDVLYPESKEERSVKLNKSYEELIKERTELKQEEKEIKKKIAEIENKIKFQLQDNESGFTDNYNIKWKSQIRKTFDSKRFKKDHPEIYKNYIQENSSRKFDIKEV